MYALVLDFRYTQAFFVEPTHFEFTCMMSVVRSSLVLHLCCCAQCSLCLYYRYCDDCKLQPLCTFFQQVMQPLNINFPTSRAITLECPCMCAQVQRVPGRAFAWPGPCERRVHGRPHAGPNGRSVA